MISFADATDAELVLMHEAIDAVTVTRPELIHLDDTWLGIVHALMNEIIARRTHNQLAAERAA